MSVILRILKLTVLSIWLIFSVLVGTVYGILRWGSVNTMHDVIRPMSRVALWILGISVDFEGAEHYEPPTACIYTANHQHALDVITFGLRQPVRSIGIGKKEIFWIPIFGWFFVAAGNVLIDRKRRDNAMAGLSKAAKAIREKNACVGIYPEGTRNREMNGLLPFKKGAFHLAIETQVPIIPMVCSSIRGVLDPKTGRIRGGKLIIRCLPPVSTTGLTRSDLNSLCEKVRTQMLEAYLDLNQKLGVKIPTPLL